MATTISGSTLTFNSGTAWTTRPPYASVGGNYSVGYDLGAYVMATPTNPKTPQAYMNQLPNVNGTAGYLIPWPTNYWDFYKYEHGGPYTAASNRIVTGFITSVSSVVNFPATNTNYYALPGTWRASGWAGDGADTDFQYFYQLFRRVA
jgi:hypothetical protein